MLREVNVTEFRNHLPKYLESVNKGNEILVTSHGQVIARLLPPIDVAKEAKKQLKKLREFCKIGDVVSPIGEDWEAENDNP
jgi:prevent-host-death family protein